MSSSTRSMIAMVLISVILLVGCASPEITTPVPAKPVETATESPILTQQRSTPILLVVAG